MIHKTIPTLGALFLAAATAHAGNWYAGLDVGEIDHRYTPDYTQRDGSPNSQFIDRADGTELSLVAGYRQACCSRFTMLYQGRIGYSDAEWTLELPSEPSYFEYTTEYVLGLSVLPTYELCKYARLSIELGLTQGQIEQLKISPVDSSYHFDEWVTGYVWGYGLSFPLTEHFTLTTHYRHVTYDDFAFKSHLPDGTHWETITDEPTSETYSAGLMYEF